MAVDADLGEPAVELRAPGAVVAAGELVDDHPADVVPVARVLPPRVAETGDEQVERGAVAPRPEPHRSLFLGGVGLGGRLASPSRALRPRRRGLSGGLVDGLFLFRHRRADAGEDRLEVVQQGHALGQDELVEPCRVVTASADTSNSRSAGTSIGSASTVTSLMPCESTPPSFVPIASPTRWRRRWRGSAGRAELPAGRRA